MKRASKIAAAALAVGFITLGASAASAAVVCNREGACWHTRAAYTYRPAYGVVVHPNAWKWGANDHYTWREHRGRGYWRKDHWVRF